MKRSVACLIVLGVAVVQALGAEVHLANGRVLEVRTVQPGEEQTWLELQDGGSMAVPSDLIVEIRLDAGAKVPATEAPLPPPEVAAVAPSPATPAGDLDGIIREAAARHGLDPELVRAVIQAESSGNIRAVSPRGAMGLMQLMPSTARARGVTDPFDPAQNIDAGTAELAAWIDGYAGEIALALAAYNAGGRAVDRHDGIPPYRETLDYVRRVLNLYLDEPLAE